jgi:hypothetical protein
MTTKIRRGGANDPHGFSAVIYSAGGEILRCTNQRDTVAAVEEDVEQWHAHHDDDGHFTGCPDNKPGNGLTPCLAWPRCGCAKRPHGPVVKEVDSRDFARRRSPEGTQTKGRATAFGAPNTKDPDGSQTEPQTEGRPNRRAPSLAYKNVHASYARLQTIPNPSGKARK